MAVTAPVLHVDSGRPGDSRTSAAIVEFTVHPLPPAHYHQPPPMSVDVVLGAYARDGRRVAGQTVHVDTDGTPTAARAALRVDAREIASGAVSVRVERVVRYLD